MLTTKAMKTKLKRHKKKELNWKLICVMKPIRQTKEYMIKIPSEKHFQTAGF